MRQVSPKAPVPPDQLAALQALLSERLGLDAGAVAPSYLEDVARRSLEATGAADLEAVVHEAERGGTAWQAVVDQAVVGETWFFRDDGPFEFLVHLVRDRWSRAGGLPTRILSCPCSTGEEPYSVAMVLHQAGLPRDAALIDAADVSASALETARAGRYRARSFRGVSAAVRDRYFEHDPERCVWHISREIRAWVRYTTANLVTGEGLEDRGTYDVVLCRNLLIYMHDKARARVFGRFRRLLADRGVLVVGHAEPGIAREHGFVAMGDPAAFAFGARAAAPPPARAVARPVHDVAAAEVRVVALGDRPAAPRNPSGTATPREPADPDMLARIRRMGDEGRLPDAIEACHRYLATAPGSADGYYLLGVLLGAAGQAAPAESALRRALYLSPDHRDALVHLALSEEARGETESAARLRARAAGLARSSAGRQP